MLRAELVINSTPCLHHRTYLIDFLWNLICVLKSLLIKDICLSPWKLLPWIQIHSQMIIFIKIFGRLWKTKSACKWPCKVEIWLLALLKLPLTRNESEISRAMAHKGYLFHKKGYRYDGLPKNQSKERRFGTDMRRLVKLVCQALLNPSELEIVIRFTKCWAVWQSTFPGILKNIMTSVSKAVTVGMI